MGKTCDKTIVIEFNGIPGAGKTTTMYEIKKILREKKIKEISPQKVLAKHPDYKEILFSKDIREAYFIFLKILLLVRPLTSERWKFMVSTFGYWYGVRKLKMETCRQKRVCILEQGIIQGFVSIAYQGKIKDEEKYYNYIGQLMSGFEDVVFVNCNINVETAKRRLQTRKRSGGRLYQIKTDEELKSILCIQKSQFEKIRDVVAKDCFAIDTEENATHNAERIVQHCV